MGEGHRDRLRKKFIEDSETLSDVELLELLLTYSIPRRDVKPLAEELIKRFGSLRSALSQPANILKKIPGLGDKSACLIKTVFDTALRINDIEKSGEQKPHKQIILPDLDETEQQIKLSDQRNRKDRPAKRLKKTGLRVYNKDLIHIILKVLPEAVKFKDISQFRNYLFNNIPVNAQSTRKRFANYILNRFFPDDVLSYDLIKLASSKKDTQALKEVVFYLIAVNEPIVSKLAKEVVWPALPTGTLSKTHLLNGVSARLNVSESTIKETTQAISRTYNLLGIANVTKKEIHLQFRDGDLDALVFCLHREFPEPGMYDLKLFLDGPLHIWMLWSKDWLIDSLYRLREVGIIPKVSEIDTVRQFTTRYKPDEVIDAWIQLRDEGNL